MIEIRETNVYHEWFETLKDKRAKARIDIRIRRVSLGNFGDVKPVGKGVSELRSIMDLATGYISSNMEIFLLSYYAVRINLPKTKIFNGLMSWHTRLMRNRK